MSGLREMVGGALQCGDAADEGADFGVAQLCVWGKFGQELVLRVAYQLVVEVAGPPLVAVGELSGWFPGGEDVELGMPV